MVDRYTKPERLPDAVTYESNAVEQPRKILLAGDTHGDANHVKTLVAEACDRDADAVFVLGDFGIWNHLDGGKFTDHVSQFANRYKCPVVFLAGNHDNYDLLFEWEATKPMTADGFLEIQPGLFYSPRGHRWTWSGVKFLSLGGAYSIDKDGRVWDDEANLERAQRRLRLEMRLTPKELYLVEKRQWSWWHQEEISEQEMRDAMVGGPVNVMLAHDKPRDARPDWNRKDLEECWPNQERLQSVVDAVIPDVYVHGHLHYSYRDYLPPTGTIVYGLDCDPSASRSSGGSGKSSKSYVLLDLDAKLNAVERGIQLHRMSSQGEMIADNFPLGGAHPFHEMESGRS
jgi:Icc-related predicted phosphoesterase